MAPLANPRALRWLAAGSLGALVLAVVCFCAATKYGLEEIFIGSEGGFFFGGTRADFGQRLGDDQLLAHKRSLQALVNVLYFGTVAFLATAVAGTVLCGLRTRHDILRWHWLSFFGLGCVAAAIPVGLWVGVVRSGVPRFVVLVLLALVCAIIDLTRRQYGAPGRIVSWFVCVLAVGTGAVFGAAALQ